MISSTALAAPARNDLRLARVAGAAAAGLALGVGEFVGAMATPSQSMVGSVGNEIIDHAPGSVVRAAIDALGTSDKPVLLTLVVLVCLGLGAAVGPAARRRPWVGLLAFAAAGIAGLVAGTRDPLADTAVTVVSTTLAVVAGAVALTLLLRLLPQPTNGDAPTAIPVPGRARGSRRAFLAWTGVAGAAGVVAAIGASSPRGTSRTEVDRAAVQLPPPDPILSTPIPVVAGGAGGLAVDGLSPLITPNADFYRIDTALMVPQVDLASWRLQLRGDVDDEVSFTYDDLLAMPQVSAPITIACVSNAVGGDLVGTAQWQGVPLSVLLDKAGVRAGGQQIVGRSLDDFTVGFPTEAALDGRTAMVALGMNGEALPVIHGFPARLIVEGLYGYVSATKWLSAIELRGWDDYDAYWIDLGWAKEGPIKTQSRIDVPRPSNQIVAGGRYTIAGVAWAPGRGISKVEVQVDDGPWIEAELSVALSDATWRQWALPWVAIAGRHEVRVRATDGTGELQTAEQTGVEPDGATGYHRRLVKVGV